jgi:hypothetical protein
MDRRTKLILLIIGSLILFAVVGWFLVWPTLKPILPLPAQPPAVPKPNPPVITPVEQNPTPNPNGQGGAAFNPGDVDAAAIAELRRRAGVLAELVESGSSQGRFENLDAAQLNVTPAVANFFKTMQTNLRKQYPATGKSYVTTARLLTTKPESDAFDDPTFYVTVQLQVQTRFDGTASTAYREAKVTFTQSSGEWIVSSYEAKAFTP